MAKRKHSEISAILQILFFHPVNMHDLSTDCRRGPAFTSNRRLVCVGAHRQEFVGEHSRCDGLSVQLRAAPARRVRKADAFVMRRRFTGACPATLKLL